MSEVLNKQAVRVVQHAVSKDKTHSKFRHVVVEDGFLTATNGHIGVAVKGPAIKGTRYLTNDQAAVAKNLKYPMISEGASETTTEIRSDTGKIRMTDEGEEQPPTTFKSIAYQVPKGSIKFAIRGTVLEALAKMAKSGQSEFIQFEMDPPEGLTKPIRYRATGGKVPFFGLFMPGMGDPVLMSDDEREYCNIPV